MDVSSSLIHEEVGSRPRSRLAEWCLPFLLLLGHAVLPQLFAARGETISLAFLMLIPLLAALTCVKRARECGTRRWMIFAAGLTLWSCGMLSNLLVRLTLGHTNDESSLSLLCFVLYGVPLIFVTASPADESWPVRLVDAALALSLGLLFFAYIFNVATMAGTNSEGLASLLLILDLENLFIALFALARFCASRRAAEREIFGALTVFAFLYMGAAGFINHTQESAEYGGLADLVIDLPFVGLMLIIAHIRQLPGRNAEVPVRLERIVHALSPLMLPAMLLAVASALLRRHSDWAVAGFAMATLVYGLRNVLAHLRNLEERDRLENLAQIDALTGLPNRRLFDETLQREWARARRMNYGLALLMIDIDHFKLLNDTLGHPEGDRRLREVARALAGCATRASDLVARYGGEEFVAILPASDAAQAGRLAEIMRTAVFNLDLPSPSPSGRVTVSIGASWTATPEPEGWTQLLGNADIALYEAKSGGRNTIRLKDA